MYVLYESKYNDFKKNWVNVGDSYCDFEIGQPLSIVTYLFPNDSGFLVELFFNNLLVGSFHSFFDSEEGQMNDAEINPKFQGVGLGKILLLVSIDVSNNVLGFYSSDSRGLTQEQVFVYQSLNKEGALKNWNEIDYEKAQQVINKIIANFRARFQAST